MNKKSKLNRKDGFTLLESIVTLTIVLIITVCVTIGISASNRLYRKSLFYSESEILSSIIDVALSDILRYSSNVTSLDGKVSFSNINYGVANGHLLVKDGRIYINLSDENPDDVSGSHLKTLVGNNTYTSINASALTIDYSDEIYTGSYTLTSTLDTSLSKTFEFTFRTLS
ncbi:MAG: type II secretion system protein [Candidatus Metalachnospira sp.]|nr:type II secretion system protein [Candidatus Metalachnospira sp.]